jgi:transposase
MRAYSLDLRERIVRAVAAGTPQAVAARSSPGRPARIGPAEQPALRAQLAAAPDATLAEHCERWAAERGVRVSEATQHRAIARLGWTRKEKPSAPASRAR